MSQKQVKAFSSSIVVVGIVALGYYVMKALSQKKEAEPTIPEIKIVEVMKEKLVYFKEKGDEHREIYDNAVDTFNTNKEIMDKGIIDVATKINTAVGTINELRTMMGREPSTIGTYDLDALQKRLDGVLKTTVVEPVKAIVEPIAVIPQYLRDRYQIR